MTSTWLVTEYFTPVHAICRILSANPFTPKAVLTMFVLLNAIQFRQTKFPETSVKAICGSLGAINRICS